MVLHRIYRGGRCTLSPSAERGITFLAHNEGDDVAVAVHDAVPGRVTLGYLDSKRREVIQLKEPIRYGHKVALANLSSGAEVTEYGVRIGVTREAVSVGEWVHTHNLRSARWQHSG